MELERSRLLIELDCLFDTRLGTILSMVDGDMSKIDAVLLSGYSKRIIDIFPGISKTDYDTRYANRDKSILKLTQVTRMVDMIKDFVYNTLSNIANSPFHLVPEIVINTYPYILTDTEVNNIIKGIATITKAKCDIKAIHRSIEELTPLYIKDNFSIVVLYEYPKWFETHSLNGNLNKQRCPEVSMLSPAISFVPIGEVETDPFDAWMELAAPFISLKLLPIQHFTSYIQETDIAKYIQNRQRAD